MMATMAIAAPQKKAGTANVARSARVVLLVSADTELRQRIAASLSSLRWEVREACGGAELFAKLELEPAATVILDSWLPDLDADECADEVARMYPGSDLVSIDGAGISAGATPGVFRNEVLHALRQSQKTDGAAWGQAPTLAVLEAQRGDRDLAPRPSSIEAGKPVPANSGLSSSIPCTLVSSGRLDRGVPTAARTLPAGSSKPPAPTLMPLPELVGGDPRMLEVVRRIRLVARRPTAVLIQGPTGTGKELVARALHRLSPRSARPFIALNCAAIPEALLEAELFGHTRGAFTGAVQGRVGRLEAANGGTLFLDEIGELPLALQAKLLRFVECGELQRVGENEPVRVDVRIVAATHRGLGKMAAEGSFRADLYYRLSVFLIETPALAGRGEDIRLLAERALARMGVEEPAKTLTEEAMARLVAHSWPGNVRELEHTLERAWILAEDAASIGVDEIDFGAEFNQLQA